MVSLGSGYRSPTSQPQTTTSYDAAGRPWKVSAPNGVVNETTYFLSGNTTLQADFTQKYRQVKQKDGNGSISTTGYDSFGRVGSMDKPTGPGALYAYDTLG